MTMGLIIRNVTEQLVSIFSMNKYIPVATGGPQSEAIAVLKDDASYPRLKDLNF